MMNFYISGQSIRFSSPVIAANSRDYLEARFYFEGDCWDGYSKWAHFRQGETVYDLNLINDRIDGDMHLNLSIGRWEVYITGTRGESRLTTVPVWIQVRESGLIDEPLHQIPLSVAEQLDSKASLALKKAGELEEQVSSGLLNGRDFQILGYYESLEALMEAVTEPERGDAYGVGQELPYDIYVYDGLSGSWVNNGSIQGPKGEPGENGASFIPRMDDSGNLSWINDKGLENPPVVNIRGDKGDSGEKGAPGDSPYTLAVKEGFSGTEDTFNWSLAHIASHARQHQAGGTDPISVDSDNIASGAVTREKLVANAVSNIYTAAIGTVWEGEAGPFTQEIAIAGLLAEDTPVVDMESSADYAEAEAQLEAWAAVYRIVPGADKITVYAADKTTTAIPIKLLCIRR